MVQIKKIDATDTLNSGRQKINTAIDALVNSEGNTVNVGFNESFDTLADLKTKYPSGASGMFFVFDNGNSDGGHSYMWVDGAWKDLGIYQGKVLAEKSIKTKYIDLNAVAQENITSGYANIFDKSTASRGYSITAAGGIVQNQSWAVSQPIQVEPGDIIKVVKANYVVAVVLDSRNNRIWELDTADAVLSARQFTIPNNGAYVIFNVLISQIDLYMATKNRDLPVDYINHKRTAIEWLSLTPENAVEISNWNTKKAQWYGDSISWQDNKLFSGTSIIAKGYQSWAKEKLGFSEIENLAVSGRPIADGTTNGVGTVTSVLSNFKTTDLVVVAGGTNDFKLDVSIGELKKNGFDRSTFYGAYQTLIEYMIEINSNQIILLMTPIQRDSGGYDIYYENAAGHKLIDYVDAIKSIGERYSLPVWDGYRTSGISMINLSKNTIDGLHLNNLGYERASKTLVSSIRNLV